MTTYPPFDKWLFYMDVIMSSVPPAKNSFQVKTAENVSPSPTSVIRNMFLQHLLQKWSSFLNSYSKLNLYKIINAYHSK